MKFIFAFPVAVAGGRAFGPVFQLDDQARRPSAMGHFFTVAAACAALAGTHNCAGWVSIQRDG